MKPEMNKALFAVTGHIYRAIQNDGVDKELLQKKIFDALKDNFQLIQAVWDDIQAGVIETKKPGRPKKVAVDDVPDLHDPEKARENLLRWLAKATKDGNAAAGKLYAEFVGIGSKVQDINVTIEDFSGKCLDCPAFPNGFSRKPDGISQN